MIYMYEVCFKINIKFQKKIKNMLYMYDGCFKINAKFITKN